MTQDNQRMGRILKILEASYQSHPMGDVTRREPYRVLIGCLLSLRTKDEVTIPACQRLFSKVDTPEKMLALSTDEIEKMIYPVGFYRNKARTLLEVSADVLNRFEGKVPQTIDELLTLKGVGRKTANLVVGLGYGLPAICVDVHVHRISNRLGYISTKTPDETEAALRKKLPIEYWDIVNRVLVRHGQQVCKPISPWCDVCPVFSDCERVDTKARKIKTKIQKS